ncbi:MAG: hypothetical protein AB1714_03000 [Acidobacteriota bacterium]
MEGPALDKLTHRLSICPAEFLSEPRLTGGEGVHVDAVVSDLMQDLGGAPVSADESRHFQGSPKERNWLRLVLVGAWLLHDEWFQQARTLSADAYGWLRLGLGPLSQLVSADQFVSDPDRREELVRHCLAALGLRPAGETQSQADDRLKTLNSVEREAVIRETRDQLERARKLREKMREEAAREAAARASRE